MIAMISPLNNWDPQQFLAFILTGESGEPTGVKQTKGRWVAQVIGKNISICYIYITPDS